MKFIKKNNSKVDLDNYRLETKNKSHPVFTYIGPLDYNNETLTPTTLDVRIRRLQTSDFDCKNTNSDCKSKTIYNGVDPYYR